VNNWKETTVKEIAYVNETTVGDGYPHDQIEYIDIASVEKGTINSVQNISLGEAPSRAKRIVRDNDILISTVRPNLEHYAFIKKAKENTVASTGFAVISPKKVEPRFLYYFLTTKSFTDYLARIADSHTSAYPAFNPDIIENAEILLPSEPEQKAIAHILGTLDDKIELNRRQNKTLEEIARATFKETFIDPTEGGLPNKWTVGSLGDEFNITMGQSPPGSTYNEIGGDMPFYQGRSDFGFRFPSRRVYCTEPTRFANAGDTLVSVRAPVGSLNMAEEKCCVGRGVAAVRHKSNSRSYTYYFMHSIAEEFERFEAEGTVFGSIGKSDFERIDCICPPERVIKNFEVLVFPIDQRIETNERQSRTLAALRDTLLPKLLSGEIRVKDAEEFLKERGL
jgi:type I restriction enzyme S subunit